MRPKRNAIRRRAILTAPAAVVLFFLLSCSGRSPEILSVEARVHAVDDRATGSRYPALSVFVLPRDEDGFSDIRELFVIHDEAELLWSFAAEEWQQVASGGETWIGFDGLTAGDPSALPGGLYRVVVLDAAGDRAETSFSLASGMIARATRMSSSGFPDLRFEGGGIRIVGGPSPVVVRIFDRTGARISEAVAEQGFVSFEAFPGSRNVRERGNRAYAYTVDNGLGLVSGPFVF